MTKSILIVDDYMDYAKLLEARLKAEGYKTLLAPDGESGIRAAKASKPDLIILDIMMPNIGGTEVRLELMKDPETKNIPILFLTGLKPPRSKLKSPATQVRVIGKSNNFQELLSAIQEELGD